MRDDRRAALIGEVEAIDREFRPREEGPHGGADQQRPHDFTQLEDFGQVMNDNIYCWYSDEEEAKLWRPALNHITFLKEETTMPEAQNNPFAGKTVVATGKLENYTRDGIQMKLLSLGARPASSVSKKTDYLIVGENAGSKLTKAQTLGVTTLTEQQFLQMLADAGIEA